MKLYDGVPSETEWIGKRIVIGDVELQADSELDDSKLPIARIAATFKHFWDKYGIFYY